MSRAAKQLPLFPEPRGSMNDNPSTSSETFYGGTAEQIASRIMDDSGRSAPGWKYGPGLAKTSAPALPRKAGAA